MMKGNTVVSKGSSSGSHPSGGGGKNTQGPQDASYSSSSRPKTNTANPTTISYNNQSRLAFFDHLPRKQTYRNEDLVEGDRILHPSTIKLGELYNRGLILADDDRVTSLIAAFTDIIRDYKTPPKRVLREDLDKFLSKQVH